MLRLRQRICFALLGALCVVALPTSAVADAGVLEIARLQGDGALLIEIDAAGQQRQSPLPGDLRTPLGSLWKLFVHAYALDTGLKESPYTCKGQLRDEVYCCAAGESIERDQALVRSCGLYFDAQRLGISAAAWRAYWQARAAPVWLLDIAQLQGGRSVEVLSLLRVLGDLPAQDELRRVLLDVVLEARDPAVIAALGGRLRAKTWSWHRDSAPERRIGGFAGWTHDGTPLWARGAGASQTVLTRFAAASDERLLTGWPRDPGACVVVQLFARYPIAAVRQAGRKAAPGPLRGEYQVQFANGNDLTIASDGEAVLSNHNDQLQINARMSREEYVARVIDREASAEPAAAARALAVVIRSYLLQNAGSEGECLAIVDSSASQRVAPRAASAAARAVAAWTADLVLAGTPVNYHREKTGEHRLSWQDAVAAANHGASYADILAEAFPRGNLSAWSHAHANCQALPQALAWLSKQRHAWRTRLDGEPGYAEATDLEVCRLAAGRPHVDRAQRRIFVRALLSQQDRLDLTHEYLHLAFAAHPNGQDESYVESLARRLLLE